MHRYPLLALFLLLLLLVRGPAPDQRAAPQLRAGMALIALGWTAQLFGAASASASIAYLGLPVAMMGMGFVLGRPEPRVLVLAFGVIPIPDFIYAMGSPEIESALGEAVGGLLDRLGYSVDTGGPLLRSGDERFEIVPSDSGLVTGVCSAEFAWYRSLRAGRTSAHAVRRAARAAGLGLLLQPLLVLVGAASLPFGAPDIGRFLLSHGVPIALALFVLAREARHR